MRATISHTKALSHQDLPGVTVFPISGTPKRGEHQQVLVIVEPNATIPLHTHEVDAKMFIVGGSGIVLSEDSDANGTHVGLGSCVFFEKEKAHGFMAGPNGMKFVSDNEGVVDELGDWDLRFAA